MSTKQAKSIVEGNEKIDEESKAELATESTNNIVMQDHSNLLLINYTALHQPFTGQTVESAKHLLNYLRT